MKRRDAWTGRIRTDVPCGPPPYRTRARTAWLSAALALCSVAAFRLPAAAEPTYELRGRIVQENGKSFGRVKMEVFLDAATSSFKAAALADPAGDFKIKKLKPGAYTLTIRIHRIGEWEKSVEIGPSFADAKRRVALTFTLELSAARRSHLISVSQLSIPDKAWKEFHRAQNCLQKHKVDCAIARLTRAVRIAPSFALALNTLGTIAYHRKDYAAAETYFRDALSSDPAFYPPLVNLGGVLLAAGRASESLAFNRSAAEKQPDDPLAHSQLGLSYLLTGRVSEAEASLQKAKSLDPGHFSYPQIPLATIFEHRRDFESAAEELREFLELHPDSGRAPEIRERLQRLGSGAKTQVPAPKGSHS